MKKLMIAAAVAAMTAGAFAAEEPCEKCTFGYKVMLVAKTTVGATVSNLNAAVCGCYRKPTMGKLVGYVFGKTSPLTPTGCGGGSCDCNEWDAAYIVLWKAWNKSLFLPATAFAPTEIDRIGGSKDQSTVEAVFPLNDLTLAGFGKAGYRADGSIAVKNLNGFFAGQMDINCTGADTQTCGGLIPGVVEPTYVFPLCGGAAVAEAKGAAYGKWQLVWDSQLVERMTKSGITSLTVRPSTAYTADDTIDSL